MDQVKTLSDFQKNWARLVEKGFANYKSLSADERIWFNIQSLIGAVDNGGLISYYYNSDADHVRETMVDLRYIDAVVVADLLEQINNLFPNSQPSTDIDQRNEVIDAWADNAYDDLFDELDQRFYALEDELEIKLVRHIQAKLIPTAP